MGKRVSYSPIETLHVNQDETGRFDFWSRFLLHHSPFLFPLFLGMKRKGEWSSKNRDQKSYLPDSSLTRINLDFWLLTMATTTTTTTSLYFAIWFTFFLCKWMSSIVLKTPDFFLILIVICNYFRPLKSSWQKG